MFVFASILNSVLRNALHSRGESPNLNMKTGVDERSLRENSFDTITAKQTNNELKLKFMLMACRKWR